MNTITKQMNFRRFSIKKNISVKIVVKVNGTEPLKVSRGHKIGPRWFKSSLKYCMHIITGTEPTFHNKHH